MYTVYVLRSRRDGKLYVGCTADVSKRLAQHEKGIVRSTKSRRPLELVYAEKHQNKYDAFRAERRYKTAKGKRELKEKI